jgi:deoxyribonuclease V
VLIGNVLRTQDKIKPLFVSIGHRVNLTTATQWVLKLAANYRLPETTRQADQLVNKTLKLL